MSLMLGLADPVHDAQRSFRAALSALSRPGLPQTLGRQIPGLPLGAAMSHLLLALSDEDTPVWWQQPDAALAQWLRFHTGARAAPQPVDSTFAVVTDAGQLPPLTRFASGSLAAPETSATVLVELPSFDTGPALQAHGPGIRDRHLLRLEGLPSAFWSQWQANHAGFPQGVDLIFTCGDRAIGLPRTTRIGRLEEVGASR
jgi:alpha-D-ribose 1-methylphosphonate 5-triphosphate synthase subunit PhnH